MPSSDDQLPSWDDVRDDLLSLGRSGRLLPFLGAAISSFAPTCLPLGSGLLDAALEGVFPSDQWPLFASDEQVWNKEKDTIRNRSAEVVLQGLAEGLENRDKLTDLYNAMSDVPSNSLHTLIVQALGNGSVPAVFTTNQDQCLEESAKFLGYPVNPIYDTEGFARGLHRTLYQFHGTIGGSGSEDDLRRLSLTYTLNSMGPRLPGAKKEVLESALEQYSLLFMGYSGWDPDIWYTLDDYLEAHPSTRIYWCVLPSLNLKSGKHLFRLAKKRPGTIQIFGANMWNVLRELGAVWGLQDPGELPDSCGSERQARVDRLRHWIATDELQSEDRQLAYGWLLVSVGLHTDACKVLEGLANDSKGRTDPSGRRVHMMSSLFAGYARRELSDHQGAQQHLKTAVGLSQDIDRVRYAQAMHKLGESFAAFETIHLWYAFPEIEWLHPGAYWLNRAIAEYERLQDDSPKTLASKQLGRAGLGTALMNLGQLYRRIAGAAMAFPLTRPFWRGLSVRAEEKIAKSDDVLQHEGDMRSLSMARAVLAADVPDKLDAQRIEELNDSIEMAVEWNQDNIQTGSAYFAKAQFLSSRYPKDLEQLAESEELYRQALDAFRAAGMKAEVVRTQLDLAGLLNREARETMRITQTSWEWQFGLRFLGGMKALLPLLKFEVLFALALFILILSLLCHITPVNLLLALSLTVLSIVVIVILYEIYRSIRP